MFHNPLLVSSAVYPPTGQDEAPWPAGLRQRTLKDTDLGLLGHGLVTPVSFPSLLSCVKGPFPRWPPEISPLWLLSQHMTWEITNALSPSVTSAGEREHTILVEAGVVQRGVGGSGTRDAYAAEWGVW